MDDVLDLKRFPLDDLDGRAGLGLVARCREDLGRFGMIQLDGLVRPPAVRRLVAEVAPALERGNRQAVRHNAYLEDRPAGVPEGHAALAELSSANQTACADRLGDGLLIRLYEYPPLCEFLARALGVPRLYPMDDPLGRVNVVRYGPGDALGWHFDRHDFTTTLLLQAAEYGGYFEYARDLRGDGDPNAEGVARLLEGSWPVESERLMPGTLNVFRGRNTAHRVTPVAGARARIVAVFAYHDRPGVSLPAAERMARYGRAG